MKKLTFLAVAFILSFFVFHSCNESLTDEVIDNELSIKSAKGTKSYIVVLNDAELNLELSNLKGYEKKQEKMKSASAKILKRTGITDGEVEHVYGTAIKGFSVKIPPGQLKKLEDDPAVNYIEEDQVLTLVQPDVRIKKKPTRPAPSESIPWGIQRVNGGQDGSGKTAWVIDTGIDFDHPDLNIDVNQSATFVGTTSADDDHGHGSHVAGTIAAIDNNIGVIGVAAGATVVAIKVLTRTGSGSTSGVIAGVDYVAANASEGDVANMSLGGGVSTSLDAAVLAASSACKFVLSAGNEGDDADNHSPARVNRLNIFTISAMDSNDDFASFSNYGESVDYCDPGVSIYSTYKGGGYATMSGTSMAAPHAAGILLLGNYKTDGTVNEDTDGNADLILVNAGGNSSENNPPMAIIVLTAEISGNKVKKASLSWTGGGTYITIYRNSAEIATVLNSGSFIDNLGKIDSEEDFTYKVEDENGISDEFTIQS